MSWEDIFMNQKSLEKDMFVPAEMKKGESESNEI